MLLTRNIHEFFIKKKVVINLKHVSDWKTKAKIKNLFLSVYLFIVFVLT